MAKIEFKRATGGAQPSTSAGPKPNTKPKSKSQQYSAQNPSQAPRGGKSSSRD
jgi:hypothetical protein